MDTLDRRNARAPRVTAAMVAERAGVSTATVSLVANGKTRGRVSEDNISRVREAISELGYVVDGIGSSLAKGVSSIVILVAPDISNPFFAKVIAGVRESLGADYQLLLSVTDAGEFPQADDVRKLLALRPAGLLVDAPNADFLEELSAAGPLVLLDAPGLEAYAPSVNLDVARGARELAAHLADSGHTHAAYIDSVTGTATFDVRRNAFLEEAGARGISVPPDCIIEHHNRSRGGRRGVRPGLAAVAAAPESPPSYAVPTHTRTACCRKRVWRVSAFRRIWPWPASTTCPIRQPATPA